MRVFLDRLYLFSGYLAGAFMLAIFVLMMVLSAGRPIGLNIPAADDFVSWCMAAMAFLGLAHTFRSGEMIRVGLLIDKLPDKSRHTVEIVCLVVGIGFIGFFAFYACQLIRDSWRFHEMSQGVISIPMWIPQIGYAAGLIILPIALLLLVVLTVLLAGGVWIAIALMACGYAGMLFVGGSVPPGSVLATTV